MRRAALNRAGSPQNDNRFAGGGPVDRFDAAVNMAREKGDGRAYVYGGTGPSGFDCSGYMSAIYNILTGRDPWSRSFSTESNFEGLGFQRGLNSRFAVGIHRGGGGPNSHMAGTLGGVNVESGGGHSSTRYGGPAAGADHSQFELKYFLPEVGGQFVSGGGGGGTAGPSPEQIAAHKKFVDGVRAEIDKRNLETASKKWSVARREGVPLRAMDAAGGPSMFDWYAPGGDVHGAGIYKVGMGAIAKADQMLASATSAAGLLGSIPDGERRALLERALAMTNTPPPDSLDQWLAGMNTLVQRESGWNPGAFNAAGPYGGAHGLAQVVRPTFESYKAPGTSNDIFDPIANLTASINWIRTRYGSITKVQQANANMPPAGYANGTMNAKPGWAIVGEQGPEAVKFRGGEAVHTFDEIVKELKTAASSEATALGNKLTAEVEQSIKDVVTEIKNGNTDYQALFKREIEELIKSMTSSAQASAQRLQVGIEDALERVLAEAGIKVDMPLQLPAGSTPEQYANSVAQQVLPQLEQMLRQHVNVKR
jgi:SLT domain-containing protein